MGVAPDIVPVVRAACGVEGPLCLVGAIALLKVCLARGYGARQLGTKHVVGTLAALHVCVVAVLVVDSIPYISSRCAGAFIGDAVRSKATVGGRIGPGVSCELVAIRGVLEPEGVAIELGCDIGGAKVWLIHRLLLVLQEVDKVHARKHGPIACLRAGPRW